MIIRPAPCGRFGVRGWGWLLSNEVVSRRTFDRGLAQKLAAHKTQRTPASTRRSGDNSHKEESLLNPALQQQQQKHCFLFFLTAQMPWIRTILTLNGKNVSVNIFHSTLCQYRAIFFAFQETETSVGLNIILLSFKHGLTRFVITDHRGGVVNANV